MRFCTRVLSVLAVIGMLLFSVALCAQTETGQISGTVTDKTGAVVPNASVTVSLPSSGFKRAATTSSRGEFAMTNLKPGTYDVKIEAAGFSVHNSRAQVTVGSVISLDATLVVGGSESTIDVVGSGGVQVETTKAEISDVVSAKQIQQMPTLNRNPYALVTLSANVADTDPGGRGAGVAINGQRSASTNITLDGADNVDQFRATTLQTVPLDAVQEFRVITSNFGPEYGRASGGILNVATKSGTNTFHGSLYEFYRGSGISANTVDNNAKGINKPRFVRNQFGYSVGGPVVKDKLFFFNSTEFIRVRSSSTQQALVAMPQFIAAAAPAVQSFYNLYGPTLTVPVGNVSYTAAQLACPPGTTTAACTAQGKFFVASNGGAFANLLATAPNTPVLGRTDFSVPVDAGGGAPSDRYQTTSRFDYNMTDKTTFFGRWSQNRETDQKGSSALSPYKGYNTGGVVFGLNLLVDMTHVFTPHVVSETKIAYNRSRSDSPLGENPFSPTLFFTAGVTRIQNVRITGPGYLPYSPGSAIPFEGPQNVYQINQDLSWLKGKHQFRFGYQFIQNRSNTSFGAFANPSDQLSTGTLAHGMDNFLTGLLDRYQGVADPQGKFPCVRNADGSTPAVGTPARTACTVTLPVGLPSFRRNNLFNDMAFYVGDSWKIKPRFTLSLGVRWEYYGVQHNADPTKDSNLYLGAGSDYFTQLRNATVQSAPSSPEGGLAAKDMNNWAPKLGFAWDVFGNGKTSLRGGYGIAYERNFGNVTFNVLFNPPLYNAINVVPADVGGTLPLSTSIAGPLAGNTGTATLPATQLRSIVQNIATAYSEQYDLALEREVLKNTVLSITYSGSRGLKLYDISDKNRPGSGVIYSGDAPNGPVGCTNGCLQNGLDPLAQRINRQYTNSGSRGNPGFSSYNSATVQLRSSDLMNSGLTVQTNYTWSHAIDNLSSTFSDGSKNFNTGLTDPFNPALDKGNADFDIRHRWVTSAAYSPKGFRNSDNKIMKYAVSGWTLSPVLTIRSGTPFTMYDSRGAGSNAIIRYTPSAPVSYTPTAAPVSVGQNVFTYLSVPAPAVNYTVGANNYSNWNALVGTSGIGASCTTPGSGAKGPCLFPTNMLQRNSFWGPGNFQMDFGMSKNIQVSETFNLQVRGEMFNALNHSNLYVVNSAGSTDIGGSNGTNVQATRSNNRTVQLALRIEF